KSYFGHGVAVDVEHHARRTVDHVVVRGADVSDPAHVWRHCLAAPTLATKQELELRSLLGCCKEELLDARFPVGHAVSDKCQVALALRIGGNWEVSVGIKSVVNRVAVFRTKLSIVIDDRLAAAVSEDEIVLWNQSAEWILRVLVSARRVCGGIGIPEGNLGVGGTAVEDLPLQQFVIGAHAAVLDNEI